MLMTSDEHEFDKDSLSAQTPGITCRARANVLSTASRG
jgi:hypothetical protein